MCGGVESALLHGGPGAEGGAQHGGRVPAARRHAALPVDVRRGDRALQGPHVGDRRRHGVALLRLVLDHRDARLPRRARHHPHRQRARHARGTCCLVDLARVTGKLGDNICGELVKNNTAIFVVRRRRP